MNVGELAELYVNSLEDMAIWDNAKERMVFKGTFDEVTVCRYSDREVGSFSIENGIIVINI